MEGMSYQTAFPGTRRTNCLDRSNARVPWGFHERVTEPFRDG